MSLTEVEPVPGETELMPRKSNYDKYPCIAVSTSGSECSTGWPQILQRLKGFLSQNKCVACVECYPGAFERTINNILGEGLLPTAQIFIADLLKPAAEIDTMLKGMLGDDPVFGRMSTIRLQDFFDKWKLAKARETVRNWKQGLLLIVGTGAALVSPQPELLVYADMARWEIQSRQRQNAIRNLGADNLEESASAKYKRAFFVDWRAADQLKKELLPKIDFLIDTNGDVPKLIAGRILREGLHKIAHHPFRVVPYFDPGPWGGHWMEEVCDLPKDVPNHAWCFDCVPEENSLLLGFGNACVEIPAIDLTFLYPRELLGQEIYSRFGAEFPIRFDLLDTMGGGNLSLQVHPKTEYIRREFGMNYTQDESYYLLDAGADGSVYLGLKPSVDAEAMIRDLLSAQSGGPQFRATEYVNQFPARKHDHFLIPAGTVHCSGKNSMVLEISATPYIFTFKLWDWGRMGLDGRPRPIHIEHGLANIQWDRTTEWIRENLVNAIRPVAAGDGWHEEVTGLHKREFIETRRHWFTGTVPHDTHGGVNVLNLVQGEEAIVESPTGAFEPYVVHYAETFIVPAAVGEYTIRPHGAAVGTKCATIKAFVRTEPLA